MKRSMELDQNNVNARETHGAKMPLGKDPKYYHCPPAKLAYTYAIVCMCISHNIKVKCLYGCHSPVHVNVIVTNQLHYS